MAVVKKLTEIQNTKIERGLAQQIFDLVNRFANYGFNRSHAAAYGVIGYQTAYLKAHYPHEFYAASMNLDLGDIEKLAEFAKDMRRIGLRFAGPDINKSEVHFSVDKTADGEKAVRWALSGIKGVGESAMHAAVVERRENGSYRNFHDFVTRTAGKTLNKKAYEGLILSGALDCLHANRNEMLKNLETIMATASADAKSRNTGQVSMFDFVPPPAETLKMAPHPEMSRLSLLEHEFNMLGMYLSGHPIEQAEKKYARWSNYHSLRAVATPGFSPRSRDIKIAAIVTDIRQRTTRKGDQMAVLTLSDPTAVTEAPVFPRDWEREKEKIKVGGAYLFTCSVKDEQDEKGESTGIKKPVVQSSEELQLESDANKIAA